MPVADPDPSRRADHAATDLDYRFWGHYTDQDGDTGRVGPPRSVPTPRRRPHRALKDSGLERFPFTDFPANQAWLQTVMWAADFVAWFQLLCLVGRWLKAKPRRLRWTLWHAPPESSAPPNFFFFFVLVGRLSFTYCSFRSSTTSRARRSSSEPARLDLKVDAVLLEQDKFRVGRRQEHLAACLAQHLEKSTVSGSV